MNTKEAVAKRIIDLCNEKNIAINALANLSGGFPVDGLQYAEREEPKSRRRIAEKTL